MTEKSIEWVVCVTEEEAKLPVFENTNNLFLSFDGVFSFYTNVVHSLDGIFMLGWVAGHDFIISR